MNTKSDASSDMSEVYLNRNNDPVTGHDCIRGYLKTLDNSPGVYRMLDAESRVLYIGKARNLRARVSSYVRPSGHVPRILRMIQETASMMFLTTRTETEALLLEQNLIKQLKPKYNVLLRDDKSFPNILITQNHPFPQIKKHRGARRENGNYFGPFANGAAVNRALNQLQRVFLLRSCSDGTFANRTRPCLLYQIKRCSGPCVDKITPKDYAKTVADTSRFLSGRSTKLQAQLSAQMQEASEALEFERAAAIRDRIRALTQLQSGQGVNPQGVSEADVIALSLNNGQACVQVFFFRANQNWGNQDFFPRVGGDFEEKEVLEAFLGQFYNTRTPPKLILLNHDIENRDLMADALRQKHGRKVNLVVPQRGEKLELVSGALRNARESLERHMSRTASQSKLLDGLTTALGLEEVPKRIEVYDNSHNQGAHAYGAMIVSGPEGFEKKHYRKFKFKGKDFKPGDDLAMMKEMLERRFSRLLKEDASRANGQWPDLILVDGGAGQVKVANSVLSEHGIEDIPLFGVAKGRERNAGKEEFHRVDGTTFMLPLNDPVLYFVQTIRDEAHRFAIGAHGASRNRSIRSNPLDEVPGVGARRKRALLWHFGSAKAVARASVDDLTAVEGVSVALAEKIYGFFHEQS